MKAICIATIGCVLFGSATAMAVSTSKEDTPTDHSVVYYQGCRIVLQQPMTLSQLKDYSQLEKLEAEMAKLETPLQELDSKIKIYSDEVERLAKRAVINVEEDIGLEHTLTEQQEQAEKAIHNLLERHKDNFDTLEIQGNKIALAAEQFEATLERTAPEVDFDRIRILRPDQAAPESGCQAYDGVTFVRSPN